MLTCGYCEFGGHHHQCPGGVRNGNGSIVRCACTATDRCGAIRCTDCNNREPGEIGPDWRCLNRTDCEVEQERKALLNPTIMRIRAALEPYTRETAFSGPRVTGDDGEALEAPARSRKVARKAGGPCLCGCGETTGGGKFRPGHDSKYLNQLVDLGLEGGLTLAQEISEAFAAKFQKRVMK
jgi:hypothetical protein